MTRRAKSRNAPPRRGRLILAVGIAFAVLLLLLRMLTFVHGYRRHW
jgi:hypothetical protein